METKDKVMYESPAAEVLEMKVERSICDSVTQVQSYRRDYDSANGGNELTWD